jgi:hypothetical protein
VDAIGPTLTAMTLPFSVRVTDPAWRAEADAWLVAACEADGRVVTGPVEQPRVRPWSTQLVVPTDAGRVWFKANVAGTAFEPEVHRVLSRLAPQEVLPPLAVDAGRGWLAAVDHGPVLGDAHEPTEEQWRDVLRGAARLQRRVVAHRDALVGAGLPDCSPSTVADRLDRLVETFTALDPSHPTHVDADLADQLRAARPLVADAAARLADGPVPATFQHGDAHPWNVFVEGGRLRLFDFGDAQWAHAVEVLMVPYGIVRHGGTLDWRGVVEGYRLEWELSVAELDELMAAAALTHPVNRALTWWTSLLEAGEDELAEYGDAPLRHLTNVLEPWP